MARDCPEGDRRGPGYGGKSGYGGGGGKGYGGGGGKGGGGCFICGGDHYARECPEGERPVFVMVYAPMVTPRNLKKLKELKNKVLILCYHIFSFLFL